MPLPDRHSTRENNLTTAADVLEPIAANARGGAIRDSRRTRGFVLSACRGLQALSACCVPCSPSMRPLSSNEGLLNIGTPEKFDLRLGQIPILSGLWDSGTPWGN